MRFDWYEPTLLDVRPAVAVGFVRELLGHADEEVVRPKRGYEHAMKLVRDDDTSVQVWWGGRNAHPHLVFTSDFADAATQAVRNQFPYHQVSRADVCEDMDLGPTTWDVLSNKVLRSADFHGVAVTHVGDFHRAKDGRSLYEGATSSEVRARLYEKGKEVQGRVAEEYRGILRRSGWTDTLCRLEFQIRPARKEGKLKLASLGASECVGFSSWARHLWEEISSEDVLKVDSIPWKPSRDDKVFYAMLHQYGKILRRLHDQLGGWDCVGLQIGEALGSVEIRD